MTRILNIRRNVVNDKKIQGFNKCVVQHRTEKIPTSYISEQLLWYFLLFQFHSFFRNHQKAASHYMHNLQARVNRSDRESASWLEILVSQVQISPREIFLVGWDLAHR